MGKLLDLTGKRYERLTVIERLPNNQHGGSVWLCKCDCGNIIEASANHLRMGQCKSCGCLRTEHIQEIAHKTKHGMGYSGIYKRYYNIKSRCYNPKVKSYRDYGARGIAMCDRWRNSFKNFLKDVSSLPHFGEEGYTLDRIDNDGNYEPGNIRWATREEQNRNTRRNHYVVYNGKTMTLKELADERNIKYRKLKDRIIKLKWSIEKAVSTP